MYNLQEQVNKATASMEQDLWDKVYVQYFNNIEEIHNVRSISKWNRQSITKRLYLDNGEFINVSEKVRYRNKHTGKVYEDIALEYISVDSTNTPGWVCKPTNIDYLVYIIEPLNRCHIFPMRELQVIWRKYNEEWFKYYRSIQTMNDGYYTHSLCVPVDTIKNKLSTIQTFSYK